LSSNLGKKLVVRGVYLANRLWNHDNNMSCKVTVKLYVTASFRFQVWESLFNFKLLKLSWMAMPGVRSFFWWSQGT